MCYWDTDGPIEVSENGSTIGEFLAKRKERTQAEQWRYLAYHGGEVGNNLVQLMQEMEAIPPGKSEQKTIARLLRNEVEIVFCSVICPDYSTERQGDEIRYTFNSLGDGIGIVTSRALEVHVSLAQFFANQGTNNQPRFTLAMADQEANDSNCLRVGLGREEFLKRLRESQKALADQAQHRGVTIETPFLTELDRDRWETSKLEAKHLVDKVPRGLLSFALRVRRKLYERWAGRILNEDAAMTMLLVQVEEYIAVGRYLSSANRIIVGLDPPIMANFVRHGAGQTPVIYFKRPDY